MEESMMPRVTIFPDSLDRMPVLIIGFALILAIAGCGGVGEAAVNRSYHLRKSHDLWKGG